MNNSAKTAIKRKTLSAPSRELVKANVLQGKILDFGCGRGDDAKRLKVAKYDPNHSPEMPKGKYDTIYCHYVLNVLDTKKERVEVVETIKKKLKKKGTAYITVRRDIKKEGVTSKGTYQENIILDLPILKEKKGGYCIYILTH